MIRQELGRLVAEAVLRLQASGALAAFELPQIAIDDARSKEHGHFASNVALVCAKHARLKPPELAALIAGELEQCPLLEKIEIAGPGFLNLFLEPEKVGAYVPALIEDPLRAGPQQDRGGINIEFVSVNPNGPVTVGSARGAAFGSALSNVLAAAGWRVWREYYVNDGVNSEQMRLFAETVKALCEGEDIPENGYRGDYVVAIADELRPLRPADATLDWYREQSERKMLERQRSDLHLFRVEFDTWFSEQSLHDSGQVQRCIDELVSLGLASESSAGGPSDDDAEAQPGGGNALMLRSSLFGDDQDRVLVRSDGRPTYISSDLAYHRDKLNRPPGAKKLITVLGPDHHGYVARLHAVMAAALMPEARLTTEAAPLSEEERKLYSDKHERDRCMAALQLARQKLEVVIFQIVRFLKDGKPAPMRKRDGNIYALVDLINELGRTAAPDASLSEQQRVGADVARFFYLMRSHETHMDFDIDLAVRQSEDNPCFYVQYAHARICSILERAAQSGVQADARYDPRLLTHERELALVFKIADLSVEVARCAEDYGVHRLTTYAMELARTFHHFYDECRVIQPDEPELTLARLALCRAAKVALSETLSLLGVSAPSEMRR